LGASWRHKFASAIESATWKLSAGRCQGPGAVGWSVPGTGSGDGHRRPILFWATHPGESRRATPCDAAAHRASAPDGSRQTRRSRSRSRRSRSLPPLLLRIWRENPALLLRVRDALAYSTGRRSSSSGLGRGHLSSGWSSRRGCRHPSIGGESSRRGSGDSVAARPQMEQSISNECLFGATRGRRCGSTHMGWVELERPGCHARRRRCGSTHMAAEHPFYAASCVTAMSRRCRPSPLGGRAQTLVFERRLLHVGAASRKRSCQVRILWTALPAVFASRARSWRRINGGAARGLEHRRSRPKRPFFVGRPLKARPRAPQRPSKTAW
jgi:hypothetical protein